MVFEYGEIPSNFEDEVLEEYCDIRKIKKTKNTHKELKFIVYLAVRKLHKAEEVTDEDLNRVKKEILKWRN